MKEIKIEKTSQEITKNLEPERLSGDLKKTIDRSTYQNKLTWQQEDSDRTLSIFRNAISQFNDLDTLPGNLRELLTKNPLNFPDEGLVLTIKNELREAIGEALRRAASRAVVKHEALMSLHEVLLDFDLGLLKEVFGSNYVFQIAKDILKAHYRVDQFEIYGSLSGIVGIHEEVVKELRDNYVNAFTKTDPITTFILKGEKIVKEIEQDLQVLLALAVGDDAGFKSKLAEISSKVKVAEAKRVLAKKAANKGYSFLLGIISFGLLNYLGADLEIALCAGAGLGLGYWLLTS